MLSIIEETIKFISTENIDYVGLLATTATIKTELYQVPLSHIGVSVLLPNEKTQHSLDEAITRLAQSKYTLADKEIVNSVIENVIKNGAKTILLACTDLQLLLSETDLDFHDTENIFAHAVINYAMQE